MMAARSSNHGYWTGTINREAPADNIVSFAAHFRMREVVQNTNKIINNHKSGNQNGIFDFQLTAGGLPRFLTNVGGVLKHLQATNVMHSGESPVGWRTLVMTVNLTALTGKVAFQDSADVFFYEDLLYSAASDSFVDAAAAQPFVIANRIDSSQGCPYDWRWIAYWTRGLTEAEMRDLAGENGTFVHPVKYARFLDEFVVMNSHDAVIGRIGGDVFTGTGSVSTVANEPEALMVDVLYSEPSKDAVTASAVPTNNFGASTSFANIGATAANAFRRILAEYDLSDLPSEVAAADIEYIKELFLVSAQSGTGQTMQVNRLTQAWAEGTGNNTASGDGATHNTYDGVNAWASAGGDFTATGAVTGIAMPEAASVNDWFEIDLSGSAEMKDDIIAGSLSLIHKRTTENNSTDHRATFPSSEDPDNSPRLLIAYEVESPDVGRPNIRNRRRTTPRFRASLAVR